MAQNLSAQSLSSTHLPKTIQFHETELSIIDHDRKVWLTSGDLAHALGYTREDSVSRIFDRNREEFSAGMSETVKLTVSGNLTKSVRIFSPRGCHLIAMFARTERAQEFRKWVLDVLEGLDRRAETPAPQTLFGDRHLIGVWQDLPTKEIEWGKATLLKQMPFTLLGYRALTREPVVMNVTAGNWVIAAHMAIVEDPDFRFVAAFV